MEGGRCKKQHTNTRAREITILLFFSCLKKSNETLNCYRLYLYLWPRYVLLTLFSLLFTTVNCILYKGEGRLVWPTAWIQNPNFFKR
jgi:hypothetical protein